MQVIDFIVYSESRSALPGGGYRIVETPTGLVVPQNVRSLITAIPDLAWVRIYDRLNRGAPYSLQPLPDASECFYIKYGNSGDLVMLQSSRLLIVQRNSGQVLYHGSASDEG